MRLNEVFTLVILTGLASGCGQSSRPSARDDIVVEKRGNELVTFGIHADDKQLARSDSQRLFMQPYNRLSAISQLHSFKVVAVGTMTRMDLGKVTAKSKVRIEQSYDAANGFMLYMSEFPNYKEGYIANGAFIEHSDKYDRASGVVITRPDHTIMFAKHRNTIEIHQNESNANGLTLKKIDLRLVGFTDTTILSGKMKIDKVLERLKIVSNYTCYENGGKVYFRQKENDTTSNAGSGEALFYGINNNNGTIVDYEHRMNHPQDMTWYDKCRFTYVSHNGIILPASAEYQIQSRPSSLGDYEVELALSWSMINERIAAEEFEDKVIKRYAEGYQLIDYRLKQPVSIVDPHSKNIRSVPLKAAESFWTVWTVGIALLLGISLLLLLLVICRKIYLSSNTV